MMSRLPLARYLLRGAGVLAALLCAHATAYG